MKKMSSSKKEIEKQILQLQKQLEAKKSTSDESDSSDIKVVKHVSPKERKSCTKPSTTAEQGKPKRERRTPSPTTPRHDRRGRAKSHSPSPRKQRGERHRSSKPGRRGRSYSRSQSRSPPSSPDLKVLLKKNISKEDKAIKETFRPYPKVLPSKPKSTGQKEREEGGKGRKFFLCPYKLQKEAPPYDDWNKLTLSGAGQQTISPPKNATGKQMQRLLNSAYPLLKAAGAFYYSWVEGKSNKLEVSMDMSTPFSLLESACKGSKQIFVVPIENDLLFPPSKHIPKLEYRECHNCKELILLTDFKQHMEEHEQEDEYRPFDRRVYTNKKRKLFGDDESGLTTKVKDEPKDSPSRVPSPPPVPSPPLVTSSPRATPDQEGTIVEDAINAILHAKKVIGGTQSDENVSS